MKHKLFQFGFALVGLFLLGSTATASNIKGNSNTPYGDYTITQTQAVVVNNVAYKAWTLNYNNPANSFTVLYSPGMNGQCCFLVRNGSFEIQYARFDDAFGARMVEPAFRSLKKKDVLKKINSNQLASQQVLSTGARSEEEYLGLIACFMPLLLN
jgi:hypothetical protein